MGKVVSFDWTMDSPRIFTKQKDVMVTFLWTYTHTFPDNIRADYNSECHLIALTT